MSRRLPNLAILLGLLGLFPFVVFALSVMRAAPGGSSPWLGILMDYGAVVLAFLGGMHWGFARQDATPAAEASRTDRGRLLLGVVPALIAWLALVLAYVALVEVGLAVLIAGYIVAVAAEDQGRRHGLLPSGSMWLRWGFSVVVVALLVTVLVLRLLGKQIV
jgi:hypothetical protein